jgi:hypothetical protein
VFMKDYTDSRYKTFRVFNTAFRQHWWSREL